MYLERKGTPARMINGQVKSVGRIPAREQIKNWLLEGAKGKYQGGSERVPDNAYFAVSGRPG